MVTEADFVAATRIRLPTKYAFQNRDGVIDASCVGRASAVCAATIVAHRSRGPNFKRLRATTEDGAVYAIDLMVNSFDFTDLAPAGVLRGTDGEVVDGILEIADARFREVENNLAEGNRLKAEAHASWRGGINYVSELLAVEGHAARPGLRAPQIGALHAIAAHWSLSKDPAIIVMPTGTGKTEVMLAVTVESRGNRILVIVPTDALRQQTADKFREYGLLRKLGIVTDVLNPVVGVLTGKPTAAQFDALRSCNIVVTTMASISRGDESEQKAFAALFSEVFFDEAHHAQATTWNRFSSYCVHARMLLFTQGLFYSIARVEGPEVSIQAFNKTELAVDFFTTNPPLVRLADGSQLSGEILLKPREELAEVYDPELINPLAWGDTLQNQESRWKDGALRPRSIQQKFIEHLEQGPSAFIVDDDDAGESADIVAIEDGEQTVTVTLWHCKYSSGVAPGNRVKDLYEVCGQAQKSTKWTWNFPNLVAHLTERETKHRAGRPTRFIRGSLDKLVVLRKASRRKYVVFRVGIVQPGLSKAGIENEHLAILGATSLFLRTVTNHPLTVISS